MRASVASSAMAVAKPPDSAFDVESGAVNDTRNRLRFPARRHEVNAGHSRKLSKPLEDVDSDLDTRRLGLIALEPAHALEGRLVDFDTRDVLVQMLQHANAPRRRDAHEHRRTLRQPRVNEGREPRGEAIHVVDDVRLEAVHPGIELLLEPLERVVERVWLRSG